MTMTTTTATTFLDRFADLAVHFGCNVQPGQILNVTSEVGAEEAVRAIGDVAYRSGAAYVDVIYDDPYLTRSRILHASEDSLSLVPSWRVDRVRRQGSERHAGLSLMAAAAPLLFDDLDPARASLTTQGADYAALLEVAMARQTNWSVMAYPTPAWAEMVHPELEPSAALEKLTEQLAYVCRFDEGDPVAAWRDRVGMLTEVAERLTARRFDALRFEGPGTDLTVGLLPTSRFTPTFFETVEGIVHMANLPSEEILSAPDPTRVDGVVKATMPLFFAGVVIEGLEVEFAGGRAVRIDADKHADALRGAVERHENGDRIGEVALVDGSGRIGRTETVFYNTLLDENAASHLALGQAYKFTVDPSDQSRINTSTMHVDFMIGSDEVVVTGRDGNAGDWDPVLDRGEWRI
jgi:aminopeptidase